MSVQPTNQAAANLFCANIKAATSGKNDTKTYLVNEEGLTEEQVQVLIEQAAQGEQ